MLLGLSLELQILAEEVYIWNKPVLPDNNVLLLRVEIAIYTQIDSVSHVCSCQLVVEF